MRSIENLLPQLMDESVFFRRADGREVSLHTQVAQLLGRGLGRFPADLAGDDDLVVTAIEQHFARCGGGGGVCASAVSVATSAIAMATNKALPLLPNIAISPRVSFICPVTRQFTRAACAKCFAAICGRPVVRYSPASHRSELFT